MPRRHNWPLRPVSCVDGEAITVDGQHRYCMLVYYDSYSYQAHTLRATKRSGYRLSSSECIEWLLDCAVPQPRSIIAGFSLGYDIAKWLEDLPPVALTALRRSGWCVWNDFYRYYYLEYVPQHCLFIGELPAGAIIERRVNADVSYNWRRAYPGMRSARIEDVFGFVQSSFVHMLREWSLCDDATLAWIESNKQLRGDFDAGMLGSMERYCIAECAYLADFVKSLQRACVAEGLKLPGWYGPGAIANALMQRHGTRKQLATPAEPWIEQATRDAYYGGRIEHRRIGYVPRLYNYDIASAYPAALAELPDLAHGTWRSSDRYRPEQPYAVWHVSWQLAASHGELPPFPWRQRGRIFYPLAGEGWYHASLVHAAIARYGRGAIRVMGGYYYEPDGAGDDGGAFAFVPTIAQKRLAYKQAGDPRHRVLKLGLNSLYGKLAQHALREDKTPPYQNYYAAGYATARTQARLLELAYADGHDATDVVALATDGLYTSTPRAVSGEGLGSWEHAGTYDDVYVIQPGVLVARDNAIRRTRGFGYKHLDPDRARTVWASDGPLAYYDYVETRFVGIGACTAHNDFSQYGQWVDQERSVTFWPDGRDVDWDSVTGREAEASYRLWPAAGGGLSQGYEPPSPAQDQYAGDLLHVLQAQWLVFDQPA